MKIKERPSDLDELPDLTLMALPKLVAMVQNENQSQIDKWGIQVRSRPEWMLYLTEEIGELADALGEREYRGGTDEHVVKEAIQVITLALKIAEQHLPRCIVCGQDVIGDAWYCDQCQEKMVQEEMAKDGPVNNH